MHNNVHGGEIDFSEIPLQALSQKSKTELALLLDIRKILPCENGYSRDWRGLVDLAKLQKYTNKLRTDKSPTQELLKVWIDEYPEENIAKLHNFLGFIDRWDVIDDTREFLKNDAVAYLTRSREQQLQRENALHQPLQAYQVQVNANETGIYTYDDILRRHMGEQNQNYDAFVLFAEEDTHFALELTERMERDGEFKFCLKQRDLMPGTIEYDAMTTLIAERCHRLIVILSPDFLASQTMQYVNLAQATGIYTQTRKVIPILYKPCHTPPNLRFFYPLKYGQDERMFNFWERLAKSVRNIEMPRVATSPHTNNVVSTDITTPTVSQLAIEDRPPSAAPPVVEATPKKPYRETPFMPPQPRLRSSKSMSSLGSKSTVAIESSNSDISQEQSDKVHPVLDKTAKTSSNFLKKFSSSFSINSTKENMSTGGGSLKKKKKKKETIIANSEELGDNNSKKDKSRKLMKFLQALKR